MASTARDTGNTHFNTIILSHPISNQNVFGIRASLHLIH